MLQSWGLRVFSFLSDLLRWFAQGLLTRTSSWTDGLPVPDRWRVTWRPTFGRRAGSGDPRRTSQLPPFGSTGH